MVELDDVHQWAVPIMAALLIRVPAAFLIVPAERGYAPLVTKNMAI
jgi:hypothetical protein